MKAKKFNALMRELLEPVLAPAGFSSEGSKHCTYWRRAGDDVYHFVVPNRSLVDNWYDVMVFPTCPFLSSRFHTPGGFPDEIGATTDWIYLNEDRRTDGISPGSQQFTNRDEAMLRRRFEKTVEPLLLEKAIRYLDQFQSPASMLPFIRGNPFSRAILLDHLGRTGEAAELLRTNSERLNALYADLPDDPHARSDVLAMQEQLKEILAFGDPQR